MSVMIAVLMDVVILQRVLISMVDTSVSVRMVTVVMATLVMVSNETKCIGNNKFEQSLLQTLTSVVRELPFALANQCVVTQWEAMNVNVQEEIVKVLFVTNAGYVTMCDIVDGCAHPSNANDVYTNGGDGGIRYKGNKNCTECKCLVSVKIVLLHIDSDNAYIFL